MKPRVFLLALLFVACWTASAQTFGEITGQVRDQSGGAIAGATVTATNTATNAVRKSSSNEAGVYSFPSLQPGLYNMRVETAGFKAATRNNLELQVQQSARVDFELQVGDVAESIEVVGTGVLLSSENATVGTVIENKRIVELPLNGRNYLQLVSLAPNVSFGFPSAGQAGSRQGGVRADQSIAVGGMRSQYNRYTLDGVENTDPNFNTFVVFPSVDALQEFKVQSGVYPAEFGRGATQINVSTRSGGNDFHGSLFSFVRNEKLDAKNYAFTTNRPEKDPFKWNQFGYTVSGPAIKNRVFFMVNQEWFRQRRSTQGVYSVPPAAIQAGDFSSLPFGTQGIFDPKTRTLGSDGKVSGAERFANDTIPQARLDSTSQQLLEFYRTPNVAGSALSNNYTQANPAPIDRDQFIGRFDFVESANSQWSGRYSWGDESQRTSGLNLNGSAVLTNFKQIMASNTRVLSPTMVNEARFGWTKFYNTSGPELAFTRDVVGELGIPGLSSGPDVQWGIPSVGFSGVWGGFGNDSEGPYENNNSAMQFIDNFSIVSGKHTFKFGGEVRSDHYNQIGNQFARGSFGFIRNATNNPALSGISGDPFADFLLGEVYQPEAAVSIAQAEFRSTGLAFYLDDTWKISQRVTISLGLRYELTPPWEDQTGKLFNGIVRQDLQAQNVADRSVYPFFMRQGEASNDPYAGIALRWTDIEVRQDGSLGNRLVGTDKNDFAPRFGITWSPSDKWVIRMGTGMFYSQDSGNPRFDMARNLAGRLRDNSKTDIPNLTWQNSLASIAGGVANVARPYTFANPYDRRTPYTLQGMLNIQRELGNNTVFEIGYLGSVSHRLESLRAVNEAIPADPKIDTRSVALRSPFPNFGRIQLVDNGGSGNYHSLGTKITKRYSNGMTYLASYTYSKSIDNATAIRNQGGDTLFPQNSYCRACERARSSHDNQHRFVTSALYELPFGRGRSNNIENGVLNAIAGGWQVGSIITFQSGFPLTMTNGLDTSNTGAFFDRPNSTGVNGSLPRGEQDPFRFFDTSAFTVQAPGTHGNVGRNTMTSPGIIQWDFSLLKDFNITESHRLQFRFEAFNFPNHPNFANPNANVSSGSNFGRITSTRNNMRNLQFALKYMF